MVADTKGTAPRAITRGGENFDPAISGDGRTLVFSAESTSAPPRLDAADVDGIHLRPVTEGAGETVPTLSADGRMLGIWPNRTLRSGCARSKEGTRG